MTQTQSEAEPVRFTASSHSQLLRTARPMLIKRNMRLTTSIDIGVVTKLALIASYFCVMTPRSRASDDAAPGIANSDKPSTPFTKTSGWLEFRLGGFQMRDTDLLHFLGPVAPGSQVTFSPGVEASFSLGVNFTKWFGMGMEMGYEVCGVNSISGASRVNGGLDNFPLLLDARVQWPSHSQWTPFAGAGVGGTLTRLVTDRVTLGGRSISGNAEAFVFSYQAFAGIRYGPDDFGIFLTYRCVMSSGASWSFDSPREPSDTIRFGGTVTHVIALSFGF
jgi:opacity protein-like surface antigen